MSLMRLWLKMGLDALGNADRCEDWEGKMLDGGNANVACQCGGLRKSVSWNVTIG